MIKKTGLYISFALLLLSCNRKEPSGGNDKTTSFCIPDSLMEQIRFDTAKVLPLVNEFKLIGQITFDQEKVVKLFPMVSGNVVSVNTELGDFVKKDQVLATIHSTEMAGVQNDLVNAQANLAVAEKNLASTTDMYKGNIASENDFIAAQKEKEKAQSELERVKAVISIYGGKQSDYIVKAPVSGFIVEKFINPDMQIRPDNGTNMFTISDLSKLWVLANVYESDIRNIRPGEEVQISTISYPGMIFKGTIDKIYNVLDNDSKTMPVRVQLENKDNLLKPGMFAEVVVHEKTDSCMLTVPANCLVFDRNKNWVVVYRNKCDLTAVPVDVVKTTSRYAYIRKGLNAGETVLTNRQLLIYSAITQ